MDKVGKIKGGGRLSLVGLGRELVFWLRNARYHSFLQSAAPAVLAACWVAGTPDFDAVLAILAIVGVFAAHMGANLLDDYFDYRCGAVKARREMEDGGMRARSMKCRYLDDGRTTTRRLLAAGLLFCALAAAAGAIIGLRRGAPILIFAGVGAFLAFFYSAPPLRLSFRGLGEASVGALFGPTTMLGVAYSACGRFDAATAAISVPMGVLVANILYAHSILDLEPDLRAGKKTFAALLGTKSRAVAFCGVLIASIYLSIVVATASEILPPSTLIVFATLPLAAAYFRAMRLYAVDPERKIERRWFYGPMEYWDVYLQKNVDWFMIRWYLSRNLTIAFAFCLLAALAFERCAG